MPLTDDQKQHLSSQKIAVTTGWGGGGFMGGLGSTFAVNCVVSVDCCSVMPTDEEIRLLQSYQEFVINRRYGGPHVLDRTDPVPGIEGHNTIILIKGDGTYEDCDYPVWRPNGPEGWAYRRMTWTEGPTFSPATHPMSDPQPPWTLQQVLDRINDNLAPRIEEYGSTRWKAWMAEHPDVFPEPTPA